VYDEPVIYKIYEQGRITEETALSITEAERNGPALAGPVLMPIASVFQ